LRRPNPFQDRYSFLASIPMFLDVAGNAFLHKERSGGGKVVALWHLRPDRVQVIPDAARHIRGYEYRLGGIPYFLPAADVIHLKTRAVWDDYYGLPPLAVAAQWVDIGNAAASFTRAFFRNAGVPSGLLNIQRSVSVAERELIRGQFRSEYGGPAGWHQTLVLDGGDAAYTAMGLPLGERGIALAALDELIEAHVVRPFGVPLELIGARLSMRGQRSAVREARAGFWDETLQPLYKLIAAQLQMGFRDEPVLGEGWDYLDFDLAGVQALQEDQDALAKRATALYQGGVIQRGEARTLVGHEATDDDKVYYLSRSSGLVQPDEILVPGAAAGQLEEDPLDPSADPNAPAPNPYKPPTAPDGHTAVSGHVRRLPAILRAAADAAERTNGAGH
jgi:HK97 family phage portal protein